MSYLLIHFISHSFIKLRFNDHGALFLCTRISMVRKKGHLFFWRSFHFDGKKEGTKERSK